MRHLAVLTGCLLCCAALFLGCGEDDDPNPMDPTAGHPPADMVGTWTFQSVTVDGAAADLGDVLEWNAATVEAHLMIQSNSAYVYEEVNDQGGQLWFESGFVFVDGNEIDINVQFDGDGPLEETSFLTFTLDAGVLTLREDDQGTVAVFTLTR